MRWNTMFITAVCVIFLIKLQWPKNKSLNAVVQLCCPHCARSDILSSFFQNQSASQPKKIQGECFTTSTKSTCKNSGTFEVKQILPKKVTYVPLAPSHSIIYHLS